MRIIDSNGKEREANSLKRILQSVPDQVGKASILVEYVEIVIAGRTRKWREWVPLEDFQRLNPSIKI